MRVLKKIRRTTGKTGNKIGKEKARVKARKPQTASSTARLPREQMTTKQALESLALMKLMENRWFELFRDLVPELDAGVGNWGRQQVRCPVHGDEGLRLSRSFGVTGGSICRTCGLFLRGDRLLSAARGWSIDETILQVRNWMIDQFLDEELAET